MTTRKDKKNTTELTPPTYIHEKALQEALKGARHIDPATGRPPGPAPQTGNKKRRKSAIDKLRYEAAPVTVAQATVDMNSVSSHTTGKDSTEGTGG